MSVDLARRAARRRAARASELSPAPVLAPLPAERAAISQDRLQADTDAERLAQLLLNGRTSAGLPLRALGLITPDRESALALREQALAMGLDGVLYGDAERQLLFDPAPDGGPGGWL
ncbi:MAG: hypothetical protein ACI8PZ_004964 [Myxococcota bacterium]|jgi:hypothetical protein